MTLSKTSIDVNKHVSRALQLLSIHQTEDLSVELSSFLNDLHPVELVAAINGVNPDYQNQLIRHVTGLDQLAALISHANEQVQGQALTLLDDPRIAAVVRRLEIDDAADVISTLPRRRRVSILKRVSTTRAKELSTLLAYDRETAGGIMTTLFLSFPSDISTNDAIMQLRKQLKTEEINPDTDISYCYLIDDNLHLKGVCSLRELLTAEATALLSDLMKTHIISVNPSDDQEKVARLIADYDLSCIPVIEPSTEKILGIITVDDIVDVIEEELTEDLLKLAGTEDKDTVGASVAVAIRSRLPWLVASCLGGIGGAMLLSGFSTTLEKVVSLAFFMPVVFGMGGNVGSQTSTITVRGIATGELGERRILSRLKSEACIGVSLGAIFGMMLCCASYALYKDINLSLIVGISIMITMTCAASFGSMLPLIIKHFGLDPAVASGPFVTTSTDIISITIYFTVASILL